MRHLIRHLFGFFALEYGLLRTIRELALRPGTTIRQYLFTDERANLSNPVGLALLTAGITVFLMVKSGSVDTIVNKEFEEVAERSPATSQHDEAPVEASTLADTVGPEQLEGLIADYYNIVLLAAIPVLSLFSLLFFKKDKFYYAEHLVINTYITGIQNVMYMPIAPFLGKIPELSMAYLGASMTYQIWVYMSIFSGTRWQRLWRSVSAFSLSMVVYSLLIAVIVATVLFFMTANA